MSLDFTVDSPWLVPDDGSFKVRKARTAPPKHAPGDDAQKALLRESVAQLDDLQKILFAHDRRAVLLVFQAMDAAGKDSTIRAVLTGVNPAGCEVHAFKRPSLEELDHDFLWRTARRLPERGRIGVFNRSYYEEVLVTKVHPEYLGAQRPHPGRHPKTFWKHRYESIREHERHLARNGTVIIKFWLNVSKEEQRQRFLARLTEPEKNWKFDTADVAERGHWPAYQQAYEDALNETSRPWAPWYAIPADDKPYLRATVADIVVRTMQRLDLRYPEVSPAERTQFAALRQQLEDEA
ncbi:PPK2 family polyphosphate kinase [Nevskia sp.]|uniref:PPK2 family polyphosphate kinase n=1 Tax=Nevskia sp. TaxID=1929292 RepID=UPI0025D6A429|nr:PPK2 family polyphosphate kinase [Nevskia sp.]HET7796406.1 PPK2 family polyphosphate kinase [Nevskia sp.]